MPHRSLAARRRALAKLHKDIKACTRCPLFRTRTQAVPGVGPADARVMLVGEAPGRQEDLKGEPFVGSAGRFLDGLLESVGLARDQVYITNVVKSRPFIGPPPGRNRAPTASEIGACRPWLDEQITIIQPEIIVAMGRIALEYFLPKKKISQAHGQPLQHAGRTVLPLYHPAVALRRRDLRDVLKQDFSKLVELVNAKHKRTPRARRTESRSLTASENGSPKA